MNNFSEKVSFIWSVADLLRGPYRPNQYKDVMLPMTVLRRLDCVLEPTKDKVLAKLERLKSGKVKNLEPILNKVSGQAFHNTSRFTFEKLKGDPDNIASNLTHYIKSFSSRAREIIEHFGFEEQIAKLDESDRLYLIVSKFCEIDLHPDSVSNIEMGYIFEELIRRFNEASNEEAGDHFTPREVIRLMVNLIFLPDSDVLTTKGIVKTLFDPACGTGGMLSVSEEYVRELNPDARLEVFGQDYNDQAYAICGSDMMIKGQDIEHIQFGDSFTNDHFPHHTFDYMLANPPFGVEWKPEADFIKKEHEEQGFGGRFGAGLPRINDGSFLFLQHMISKMKPKEEGGSRLAIVFNRSPLYAGDAESGESNIREWILRNDWLEAIIALPTHLFYNTGIPTYIWVLSNRKSPQRKGKVQLIDASDLYSPLRKSLGEKQNEISAPHIEEITRIYGDFLETERSRIFENTDFYFTKITIERPLRLRFQVSQEGINILQESKAFKNLSKSRKKGKNGKQEAQAGQVLQDSIIKALSDISPSKVFNNRDGFSNYLDNIFKSCGLKLSVSIKKAILSAMSERSDSADICLDKNGNPEPDPGLRDFENVPYKQSIDDYFATEVQPYYPDAWVDKEKSKSLVEIPFMRHFIKHDRKRPLTRIMRDVTVLTHELYRILSRGDSNE